MVDPALVEAVQVVMGPVMGEIKVILAIIIGVLAALVYALRVLVLMERRVARIDKHIELLAEKIVVEERAIEKKLGIKKR